MPKMKPNKGAAKRFKVTKTGLVKKRSAERAHGHTKKTTKRKRHLRKDKVLAEGDTRTVHLLLSGG